MHPQRIANFRNDDISRLKFAYIKSCLAFIGVTNTVLFRE
jgi:hypothetical protein